MKKIDETIRRLANSKDFQNRYETLKRNIINDPYVKDFLSKNKEVITSNMVDKSLNKLNEYISQSKECEGCTSLESCKNMLQGYTPLLTVSGNSIDIYYEKCPRKIVSDERKKQERLINSIYVPKEILKASLGDIEIDKGRIKAIQYAKDFVRNYSSKEKQKGLYLHGAFGTGKSFLLGAIANELAKKQVASLIVYVPEFFREMKNSIGDNNLNDKLDLIKKAPILMLDDLGAETMSSWARDEILGTILQFRMMEELPTFISSNFNYQDLQHHLTYSQRGEEEEIKAARIMERIKFLTIPVLVEGPNRRK